MPEGEKGKSVDLTQNDVFTTLTEKLPDAANIVLQSCDVMGIERPQKLTKQQMLESKESRKKQEMAKLDESLLPKEVTKEDKSICIV